MGLELRHRLDRQASRAQQLQIVEVEMVQRVAQRMKNAVDKTKIRPAGSLGVWHEEDVGRGQLELRRLRKVVMNQHLMRSQAAGKLVDNVSPVDRRHHDK